MMKKKLATILLWMALAVASPGLALAHGGPGGYGGGGYGGWGMGPGMMGGGYGGWGMGPGMMGGGCGPGSGMMGYGMMGMGPGMGFMGGGPGYGMMGIGPAMMGGYGVAFTDEQQKKFADIQERYLQRGADDQAELIKARAALYALLIDPDAKDQAIENRTKKVAEAQAKLFTLRLRMAREVEKIYTKEQREQFMRGYGAYPPGEGTTGPGSGMHGSGMMGSGGSAGR